jgi:hypothetical protein
MRATAPFFLTSHPPPEPKEHLMIFDSVPVVQVAKLMEEASARTGFTLSEIEALVESELDTSHLLEYLSAVMSNRMN